MRENILDEEQSQDLRIYAVWLNQRPTDGRDTIDESTLADPRVTQYWDGEGITGTYFAENDLGGLGYSGLRLRRLLRLRPATRPGRTTRRRSRARAGP